MELIKKLISNKTVKYGILIGIFALIIYIALSVGLNKFKKQQKLENEVYKPREVFFTLYHVDWCPYCQTTIPVYEDVSGTFGNTVTKDGAKII